jgi:pyridoxine 5-phosphate synthase
VHLREDRRHIQPGDVRELKEALGIPLNLEMANVPPMVDFALSVKPAEVCLVPERREELTTEGGLDVAADTGRFAGTVRRLGEAGLRVSLFIEPSTRQLEAAAQVGAPCVELHTGAFCAGSGGAAEGELDRLLEAARAAHRLGLQVNAGHGIHLGHVPAILRLPHLDTLNIGHSIVSHAVMVGMAAAVRALREALDAYQGGEP